MNLNDQCLAANPVYEKMVEFSGGIAEAAPFLEVTLEEFPRNPLGRSSGSCWRESTSSFRSEKQYRAEERILIWVRNDVSLVPGPREVPRFLMALLEDITERGRMAEALNKARSETRAHIPGSQALER